MLNPYYFDSTSIKVGDKFVCLRSQHKGIIEGRVYKIIKKNDESITIRQGEHRPFKFELRVFNYTYFGLSALLDGKTYGPVFVPRNTISDEKLANISNLKLGQLVDLDICYGEYGIRPEDVYDGNSFTCVHSASEVVSVGDVWHVEKGVLRSPTINYSSEKCNNFVNGIGSYPNSLYCFVPSSKLSDRQLMLLKLGMPWAGVIAS